MTRRYLTQVLVLSLVGALLASQPLASAGSVRALNWLGPLLDEFPHLSQLYLAISGGLQLLLGVFLYACWLKPEAARRHLGVVWLNAAAALLPVAGWLAAQDVDARIFPAMMAGAAAATLLGPPTLLLGVEAVLALLLRRWGLNARARGWRFSARRLLRASLRLRPAQPAAVKALGLLLLEGDDFEPGLAILALLGPVERLEDDQVLRAMEQAWRTLGNVERAVECLLRLRQLRYDTPGGLDRRILDDLVRLERWGEALELLESGRLKPSIDLLLIQQQANVRLGNYAQALLLIQKIADQEGPPHARSTRLYQQLMALLPDNLEIRIHLGLLLLDDESEPQRREGAELLEDALISDPTRLHLSRRLARYYAEHKMQSRERDHWRRLVEAGDLEADPYLNQARVLVDENRLVEAAQTLLRLTQVLPEDWRGHLRLARVQLQLRRVAEAEASYRQAAERAPAAETPEGAQAAGSLRHLRQDLDQWQRDQRVSALAEAVRQNEHDREQRLGLLDECIAAGNVEQLLRGAEELLAAYPDAVAAVEERLRTAIEQAEQPFRLLDFLADLLYTQRRDGELLELYRRMARASLHPAQTMITGCQRLLARAPDFLEARLELALAQRLVEDWAGLIATLDPVMGLPLAEPTKEAGPAEDAESAEAAESREDSAAAEHAAGGNGATAISPVAGEVASAATAAALPAQQAEAAADPFASVALEDFFNLGFGEAPAAGAQDGAVPAESVDADSAADADTEPRAVLAPAESAAVDPSAALEALVADPAARASLAVPGEDAARVNDPRIEPADKALWVEAAFRLGRFDEAISAARELLEPLADEPGFMIMMIDLFNQAGRPDEAYEVFLQAKAASPRDAHLARLERRVFKNRREHRLRVLGEKHDGEGLTPAEHFEKAELHRDKGEIQDAIVHYQRAADKEELARIALAKMASSLCERGLYELAEELMEPIHLTRELDEHYPELKELIYELARALEKIKKPQQAARFYKRIFHVDAAYRDVVARLERL